MRYVIIFFLVFLALVVPKATATDNCVNCHSKQVTADKLEIWEKDSFEVWSRSVHGANGVECNNCHGGDPGAADKEKAHNGIKGSTEPTSPIYYENVPETCAKCHAEVYEKFIQSKHYQNLKAGKLAPTCTTCHGFHMAITKVKQKVISKKCSVCHNYQMGVNPSIPWKAAQSLALAKEVEYTVDETQDLLKSTKNHGADALDAETELIVVRNMLNNSRYNWHSFNLYTFYTQLQEASKMADQAALDAKKAYYKEYGRLPEKEVCGPTAVLLLASLAPLIRKRLWKLWN